MGVRFALTEVALIESVLRLVTKEVKGVDPLTTFVGDLAAVLIEMLTPRPSPQKIRNCEFLGSHAN
jgi:hypothetical protein